MCVCVCVQSTSARQQTKPPFNPRSVPGFSLHPAQFPIHESEKYKNSNDGTKESLIKVRELPGHRRRLGGDRRFFWLDARIGRIASPLVLTRKGFPFILRRRAGRAQERRLRHLGLQCGYLADRLVHLLNGAQQLFLHHLLAAREPLQRAGLVRLAGAATHV